MIGLESFVSAIACLCASSYGPPSNLTITTLEQNIVGALSNSDRNVLQIFLNSKSQFIIPNTYSKCPLPDEENIDMRLQNLEFGIKKQRELSQRLEKELQNLSSLSPRSNSDCNCNQKDAEIKALREKIVALEKTITDTRNLMLLGNVCLLTETHGILDVAFTWPLKIFCDQHVDKKHGRGWMLMAQRFDGSEHFYRSWFEYSKGFGLVHSKGEFFMGLEALNSLTTNHVHELLFVMIDNNNLKRYAHYDAFEIGDENEKFILKSLGKFEGDAGDSLKYHIGQNFSTYDRDNDKSSENCATKHSGAWWYKNCLQSNLFGIYETNRPYDPRHPQNGMIWSTFHDNDGGYLTSMRMYVRPRQEK